MAERIKTQQSTIDRKDKDSTIDHDRKDKDSTIDHDRKDKDLKNDRERKERESAERIKQENESIKIQKDLYNLSIGRVNIGCFRCFNQ